MRDSMTKREVYSKTYLPNMKILLIHPRKGLFAMTTCSFCSFQLECENCDCKLTTYRSGEKYLELVCHQCQSYYNYPNICPKCSNTNIVSMFGGIDDLAEKVEIDLKQNVIRLDKLNSQAKIAKAINNDNGVFLTTRVFDPAIEYNLFEKIIFIQAENLLASPDYLVFEELIKNLAEIFLQIGLSTQIIFDTANKNQSFFSNLSIDKVQEWFQNKLQEELLKRQKYHFPPFVNLLLVTTQEKNKQNSINKIKAVRDYFIEVRSELGDLEIGNIYPARMLKRKGYFSHHLQLKYPKNYTKYFEFQKIVLKLSQSYHFQTRLNPRHTF